MIRQAPALPPWNATLGLTVPLQAHVVNNRDFVHTCSRVGGGHGVTALAGGVWWWALMLRHVSQQERKFQTVICDHDD